MYQQDRAWGDSYAPQVFSILTPLIHKCVELSIADVEMDNKQATDFTIKLIGGSIAVRLRRPKYNFRDLTIRAHRENGTKTELAKIKEGYAYRYFYGWTDINRIISEWILVDLDKLRTTHLLEKTPIKNYDGTTSFIAIPAKELNDAGCLLASQLKTSRIVNTQASPIEGIERARKRNYVNPDAMKAAGQLPLFPDTDL